ncbi:MAG: S-layer homology domain-containing protein [Bacillota bacterium]|nr:S-layer homology domain-containing protein [Bacillota bacterium]
MKRKISLILASLMVLSLLFYANVFAATDSGLENAVKAVKSKITIPANYSVFNFRNGTEGNKKVWSLDWNAKDGSGAISVGVDEKGNIIRYYNNKSIMEPLKRKIPKVSKQDAKTKAEAFIKGVAPSYYPQTKYYEIGQRAVIDIAYNFNYVRIVNGILFPANYINVSVNSDTGDVQSYNATWSDDAVFPAPDKVISKEDAEKAYVEKLGLGLFYQSLMENNKLKLFAMYAPKSQNEYIDAFTGEKTKLYFANGMFGNYEASFTSAKSDRAMDLKNGGSDQVALSPDEIKAIEDVSKIISKEDMEKKLRDTKILGLTNEYTVKDASIEKYNFNSQDITWRMYFVKGGKEIPYQETVSVSADAKTGDIKEFWISASHKDDETPKFDKEASKTAVEEFLKEMQPDKFKACEYDINSDQNIRLETLANEKPREYSFNYLRKVNGAIYPSDNLSARYDAISGKIVSYTMNWTDADFPSLDKVVSVDKVYDNLFKNVGLQLQYRSNYPDEYMMKFPELSNEKQEIKLVYALNTEKPSTFDANTGELITSDGKPYIDLKTSSYDDIKGHFAEKYIKILAEYGIAFEGSKFNPDKDILQKDFMKLLYSLMNYGGMNNFLSMNDSAQIDEMYKNLIAAGVIKAAEKAPDSKVTREDSVKFIIRLLKYDKIADLKGIYNCTYKDKNKIDPSLIGYVVIADGLNIVKGTYGYFNPKKTLTRAEAIILAYNYLQN